MGGNLKNKVKFQGRISKSKSSTNPDRSNKSPGHNVRTRTTVNRLAMYKSGGKAIRNSKGKIIRAAPFQSSVSSGTMARIEPNRRWFGNTRVIGQQQLEEFREAMNTAKRDPYTFVMHQKKLPMSLLRDMPETTNTRMLSTEPFEATFGPKSQRKRPKISVENMADLARASEEKHESYDASKDRDLVQEETGERECARDWIFGAGQSKRIWSELYKVIDASDVLVQVLDARDPMGTRSEHVENYLRKEKPHKHLVFVLNKCDLVPTWSTVRWVASLSAEYPTLAFHASINNSFGKGSLIQLLRQIAFLHKDKQQISVGFIGYPNVGKSSIINTIMGQKSCKTAPIPGETKVWQYVRLTGRIYLIDCPGVVPPSEDSEANIILKGVVRLEHVQAPEDYIPAVLERARRIYINRVYGIEHWNTHIDFLEQLAKKTGKLLKGGDPNVSAVARIVLQDWQRGRLPYFIMPPDNPEYNKDVSTNNFGVTQKIEGMQVTAKFDAVDLHGAALLPEGEEKDEAAVEDGDGEEKEQEEEEAAGNKEENEEEEEALPDWDDLDASNGDEEAATEAVEVKDSTVPADDNDADGGDDDDDVEEEAEGEEEDVTAEDDDEEEEEEEETVMKKPKQQKEKKAAKGSKKQQQQQQRRAASTHKGWTVETRGGKRVVDDDDDDDDDSRRRRRGPKDKRMTTSKRPAMNYYDVVNVKNRKRRQPEAMMLRRRRRK
ncbi:ribosome export GTPase [Salpingoeca rosetta]|uniref:Nucleolar GTP-binding protein 2 n=1 Tax=Salpingoeca rosetta (strain ATCC 50818 / BSB-021) TaxID=946362 RepID=F2UEJ4_SALR5|nr:ribosome export GTPase [Salpingoeca rosetta]EGD75044.1 ribosome export GTPase [Salpingoeca rosetta]|eukprot:XP_004992097.1 ribosome export GTPase [Salpingoeca rosetta]